MQGGGERRIGVEDGKSSRDKTEEWKEEEGKVVTLKVRVHRKEGSNT